MKRYWSGSVAAIALAVSAGLAAQGQNPANTPPPDAAAPAGTQRTPASPSAQTRTDTMTITGCLQTAPMTTAAARETTPGGSAAGKAPDAAGTSARSATDTQFILSSAAMAGGKTSAGPVGTSGATASTYRLQGDTAMLSPHLNKRVEISGTLQSGAATAAGAPNASGRATGSPNAAAGSTGSGNASAGAAGSANTSAGATSSTAESASASPTLRVESVRMLAETCAAGTGTTTAPAPSQPRQQ